MSRIKVRSLNVSYPPHYIGNRYGTLPSVSTVPACPNSIDVQVFKSELTNKKREQLNKFFTRWDQFISMFRIWIRIQFAPWIRMRLRVRIQVAVLYINYKSGDKFVWYLNFLTVLLDVLKDRGPGSAGRRIKFASEIRICILPMPEVGSDVRLIFKANVSHWSV